VKVRLHGVQTLEKCINGIKSAASNEKWTRQDGKNGE